MTLIPGLMLGYDHFLELLHPPSRHLKLSAKQAQLPANRTHKTREPRESVREPYEAARETGCDV